MARSDETRAAWLLALEEMEAAAGAAGDTSWEPSPWSPAALAGLGPLPVELAPRAHSVAAQQKSALARVLEARNTVVRHIAALKQVPPTRETDRAVYLDASA